MLLYIKAFLHSCECVLQHICNSSVSNALLLCNKSITIASHRQGVSVDFLRENAKKIKISRSENVSQAQQVHPRYRKFVTSVLRFTVFRIVSSHLTCCILFFYTFSAVLFMHFLYVYSLICIFQSVTDFCVRFFRPTPLPQPFSGLQPAFGCTFCNKKQHRQPFQGHLCCAVFLT